MPEPTPITIASILARVDAILAAAPGWTEVALSKDLFGSGHAIPKMRAGKRRCFPETLARADKTLRAIEAMIQRSDRRRKKAKTRAGR